MDGTSQRLFAYAPARRLIATGLLIVFVLSGCAYDPRRFQLPQLWPRHPSLERRLLDYHDAFPDDALGPESSFRPLGFHQQRTLTRRTDDLRKTYLLKPSDLLPPDTTRLDLQDRRAARNVQP